MADPTAGAAAATEQTPLLSSGAPSPLEQTSSYNDETNNGNPITTREKVYQILEGRYKPIGPIYEGFTIFLIIVSIAAFVVGSLFDTDYNGDAPYAAACGKTCDMILFGNDPNNGLGFLGLGEFSTSIIEVVTIAVFTVDYLLRLWTADLESSRYAGFTGRLRYLPTFYSIVDLASTVPFYVDALTPHMSIEATQFLRMFRFFRMLRVEGRYELALTLFDDVFTEQRSLLGTALFIGCTTWVAVASLYYMAERRNTDMIYCPDPASDCEDGIDDMDGVDTSLCKIDSWGITDCTDAGCPPSEHKEQPCYNVFNSIPSSSYFALLNLFGEFPLITQHSTFGKFVGTLTAVVAVAVFALPTGLLGNGIEDILARRKEAKVEELDAEHDPTEAELEREHEEVLGQAPGDWEIVDASSVPADESTMLGRMYNFLELQTSTAGEVFDWIINALIIGSALSFMVGTVAAIASAENPMVRLTLDNFEFLVVLVFTIEYLCRFVCSNQDPRYRGTGGRFRYVLSPSSLVDLAAFVPYWIQVGITGTLIPHNANSVGSTVVRVLRLCRIFRFERYTKAFDYFDDVIRMNADILIMTGFTALIVWVFFSAALYVTERDNPDPEMKGFYKTVPHAMWVSLLNLSGEAPLCNYTTLGKVLTGVIGLFATALFGIPIGILGAGFEEMIEEVTEETPDEEEETAATAEKGTVTEPPLSGGQPGSPNRSYKEALLTPPASPTREAESIPAGGGAEQSEGGFEEAIFQFVNGEGSRAGAWFEIMIYVLILITVFIGIIQTIEGQEDTLGLVEWVAVVIFTIEYILRFIGAPADPYFAGIKSPFLRRLRYIFSFYSIIDLFAILPFYLALAMPGSWVDQHDEYLRMLRLLRLLKLDKYIPSISLIDDVFRLKRQALTVTGFAAGTLWIIFSGFLYLTEYTDDENEIDEVPVYGCDEDCTMMDRFRNYFDSVVYTCIHLTGDYPIITYSGWARVTCFIMVVTAVGVVAVPSGVVASGFSEIVQSKAKKRRGEQRGAAGDDWYEFALADLEGTDPPPSLFGPAVDRAQTAVNLFLNGSVNPHTGATVWGCGSSFFRIFMMTIIIANVLAVLVETVPEVDRFVGNEKGNFFDVFEAISIFFFSLEYALRLFSARKNLEALYSPWVYATTFFGIVDFLSTAPWYVERLLLAFGMTENNDTAMIFRVFRIFRILQLEDFLVGFRKIDNVFRASKDVLKATGLMALIIWVGCGALFFIFEQGNPNWRECDPSIPLRSSSESPEPGCYDFESTAACIKYYGEGMCTQTSFTNMPDSLYYVAVFLGGEWGLVDFTWPGRFVCMFLCVIGIALYAIPVGTLFDSFGAVIGISEDDEDDESCGDIDHMHI